MPNAFGWDQNQIYLFPFIFSVPFPRSVTLVKHLLKLAFDLTPFRKKKKKKRLTKTSVFLLSKGKQVFCYKFIWLFYYRSRITIRKMLFYKFQTLFFWGISFPFAILIKMQLNSDPVYFTFCDRNLSERSIWFCIMLKSCMDGYLIPDGKCVLRGYI